MSARRPPLKDAPYIPLLYLLRKISPWSVVGIVVV